MAAAAHEVTQTEICCTYLCHIVVGLRNRHNYAAVLISRITDLARPSVKLSVSLSVVHDFLTRKQTKTTKKLMETFLRKE